MLGLLPSKILNAAEREKTKKGSGLQADCLELYRKSLTYIVEELVDLQRSDYESGNGHEVLVHGLGTINLHFEVAIVIGDTVGHDTLCCHYKSYTNKIARPIRSCYVSCEDLDNQHIKCNTAHMHPIYNCIKTCMSKISRKRS